jgi:phosphatidylglycerophosphatase A
MILMIIGGWEIILILSLALILLLARSGANFLRGGDDQASPPGSLFVQLWVAQGFGVGLMPFAPGMFGSLIGIVWFGLLLATGHLWVFVAGTLAGIALSVWLCGVAERILKQKDPGSVVLDEIVALPICFSGWVIILLCKTGKLPVFEDFFGRQNWPLALGVFVAFRFFDVIKPWPVGQSQALPGGWGITVDDVLAAVYVNGLVLLVYGGRMILAK